MFNSFYFQIRDPTYQESPPKKYVRDMLLLPSGSTGKALDRLKTGMVHVFSFGVENVPKLYNIGSDNGPCYSQLVLSKSPSVAISLSMLHSLLPSCKYRSNQKVYHFSSAQNLQIRLKTR